MAIASGAAAGGIVGGAGAWGGLSGLQYGGQLAAFAAAPAAGASAAAISGSDPGVGALIAVSAAAFSLGVQQAYNKYQEYALAGNSNSKGSEDLLVAKNSSPRSNARDIRPGSGVPDSPEEAFGEAIKGIYDMQQDMAGRLGNKAESNVNFRRDIDQLSLTPGSKKGQWYYTDDSGNVVGGPTDRPALHEGLREHFRFLQKPGPPQLRQGR